MYYSTKEHLKSICPNSVVQEVYLPNYEVELDFINHIKEQERFLAKHERELLDDEVITIMFDNIQLPQANMASISSVKGFITYQLSLTLWYSDWDGSTVLPRFILNLLSHCSKNNIDLKMEDEDPQGYYLLASLEAMPEVTIEQRVSELSSQLSDIIAKLK